MLESAIQSSAINPGFGGGPLFDNRGRLLGITSLNLGQVGRFSLAVPVHLFADHRQDLLRFGHVQGRTRRAWVGIYAEPTATGVVVSGLVPDGPAALAGVQEGDVIVTVNFGEVATREEMCRYLWQRSAGSVVRLGVVERRSVSSSTCPSMDRGRVLPIAGSVGRRGGASSNSGEVGGAMASEITRDKLRGVLDIVHLANAENDLDNILALVPQQACTLLEADRAALYLMDKAAGEIYSAVALGLTDKTIRLKLHQGVTGMVAGTGKSILITDAYADPRFYRGVDELTGYHTQQILCVPIKNRRGEILGVLELLNKRTGDFTPEDE
jgi:putative methionine-R-sulfoxide reductase with GAF domain